MPAATQGGPARASLFVDRSPPGQGAVDQQRVVDDLTKRVGALLVRQINAAIRSVIWLGGAAGLAYIKKPDDASVLAVRPDAIGWLAGGICVAGLALHVWSNVSLARGERHATAGTSPLVTDGPFRYVRNPMYLAGITLLLGVGLLYPSWDAKDLLLPLLLLVYFHWAVVRVEEPALRRHFGPTYEEYCKRVPRWLPPNGIGGSA